MRKTLFFVFVLMVGSSFVEPSTQASIKLQSPLAISTSLGVLHWYFDHTYVGYDRNGCRIYFTGVIDLYEDGRFSVSPDFRITADCYTNYIKCDVTVNAARTAGESSQYLDSETDEAVSSEDANDYDSIFLATVQGLKE
jgi:hypothetical protein